MSLHGKSWYAGSAIQPSGNGLTCAKCGEPCVALYPGGLCKKHWEESIKPELKPNPFPKQKLIKQAKVRKWKRRGSSANKKMKKAYQAKYYAEHREERKARQTKYYAEHREEQKVYQAKYRARVRRSKLNKGKL